MRISIVTVSYNQAEFLPSAIESVLSQDHPDIEYIVVDPGSSDSSRNIIEKYRNKISKIIFDPDNGPADGLNKGFCHVTGDVLGFLNADDTLLPGTLTKVATFMRANENVDIVSGHCHIIDRKGHIRKKLHSRRFDEKIIMYGGGQLIQPSTFFRRDIFEKSGGFNADNRKNWDTELWFSMHKAGGQFALMNDTLSQYRLYPETITAQQIKNRSFFAPSPSQQALLERIKKRQWDSRDSILRVWYMATKVLREPRWTFERITKGPVNGR